jgi:choline-sulfatase
VSAVPKPRNVLLVTADQFRADFLGCAGAGWISTPNYDRLASEGVRFSRAFASNPICVPARATITTGRHSHKCTGSKNNDGLIRDGQPKIAEVFNAAGYETYAMGKLHYVPYQLPRLVHGFRHWELTESGRLMWQSARSNWNIGTEEYWEHLRAAGWENWYRAHGIGNNDVRGTVSALPAELAVDHWVVDRTLVHLERHLAERPEQPFFMWTSFPKPHSPYDPPEPWHRLYDPRELPAPAGTPALLAGRNPELRDRPRRYCWDLLSPEQVRLARARYAGSISFQDEQVGRVLAFLEERRLLDDTVILFTADHGDLLGDFGCFFKSCFLEGSEHIPLIMRAPGLPAGEVREALAGTEDVLPTLCELAGLPAPDGIDGLNLAATAAGGEGVRELYVAQTGEPPEQCYMATDGRWKYCYCELDATEELYDLVEDPRELRNLAAEAGQSGRVSELRGVVVAWCRDNGDAAMLDAGGDLVESPFRTPAKRPHMPGPLGWRPY